MAMACFVAQAATRLELDSYGPVDSYSWGEPWEYKATQSFTTVDGTFRLSRPYVGNPDYVNSVHVGFTSYAQYSDGGRWIDLDFSTDKLGVPLEEGIYLNAQRFPFNDPGRPGLGFSDTGFGFNTLNGQFQIFDIERDGMGNVTALAASFQIFDYPAPSNSPLLSGRVWYNSDAFIAPVPVPAALWFFGSGLIGLVGAARVRRVAG